MSVDQLLATNAAKQLPGVPSVPIIVFQPSEGIE